MRKLIQIISIISLLSVLQSLFVVSQACSRFTYATANHLVITGRSMDWFEDIHTDLWAFPAGMKRTGGTAHNSVTWTSKYGSVIAAGYNLGAADGMNTKGLDANLLYLSSSDYGTPNPAHQNLSVLSWVQYILDNYATVDEAVKGFEAGQFNMIAPELPNNHAATLHLAITDQSGDNAIFEYINGKLVVHQGKQYTVMTNEPSYEKQLALNDYWQNLKGAFLPGTSDPADRFVRASYYLSQAPKDPTTQQAIAVAFSIIRDVSVPMGAQTSGRPNVAATIWRSVADLTHETYYFENTDRPNVFWVDMNKLDLKSGAPAKKLSLAKGEIYAGDVSKDFVTSKPFEMQ